MIVGTGVFGLFALLLSIFGALFAPEASALVSKPSPYVANNSRLRALTDYDRPVVRDGYDKAGDGGYAIYTHSTDACSLNGGAGDNGAQVIDATGTGCWSADLSHPISAAVWGVKSDGVTDDEPAWSAAINALWILKNGGTLTMPSSHSCSRLNETLTIGASNVRIVGAAALGACFTLAFPTGNGIEIGGRPSSPTVQGPNKGPYDVSIAHIGIQNLVARTSGADLSVYQAHYTSLDDVQCKGPNYWICIDIGGNDANQPNNLDTELSRISASYGGQTGIRVGCMGATSAPVGLVMRHIELDNHNGAAEEVCQSGGISQSDVNTDFNYIGFWAHPTNGQHVSGIFSINAAYDANGTQGFFVDTSRGGYFNGNKFQTLWVAACGTAISSGVPNYGPSRCMTLSGGSHAHSIVGNTFDVLIINAGQDCLVIDRGVTDDYFSGQISGCSQSSVGTYHGLYSAGATHWTWSGGIGVDTGAVDREGNSVIPQYQDYGVYVTGASDYFIISGDLSRNHSGAIFNNASGRHFKTLEILR